MSDRICLMNQGRIEQLGTPDELYFRPATAFRRGLPRRIPTSFAEPSSGRVPARGSGRWSAPRTCACSGAGERGRQCARRRRCASSCSSAACRAASSTCQDGSELVVDPTHRPRLDLPRRQAPRSASAGTPRKRSCCPHEPGARRRRPRPPLPPSRLGRAPGRSTRCCCSSWRCSSTRSRRSCCSASSTRPATRPSPTTPGSATRPSISGPCCITFQIAGWTTLFAVLAGYPVAYLLANTGARDPRHAGTRSC